MSSHPASYNDLAGAIAQSLRGHKFEEIGALQTHIKGVIDGWIAKMKVRSKSGGDLFDEWSSVEYGCGCSSHTTWHDGQLGAYGHETKHTVVCSLGAICGVYENR